MEGMSHGANKHGKPLECRSYEGLRLPHWWRFRLEKRRARARNAGRVEEEWLARSGHPLYHRWFVRGKLQGEPVVIMPFPSWEKSLWLCQWPRFRQLLQRSHIAQTTNQGPNWGCYADRKKQTQNTDSPWVQGTQEITSTGTARCTYNLRSQAHTCGVPSLAPMLFQMLRSRSVRGSALSHLHPKNNYMIKQTKMKWNLINPGSSGTEWRLTNR